MKVIVFDTETTTLPRGMIKGTTHVDGRPFIGKGEIIQLTALVCNEELQIEQAISFYCKPSEPITDEAFAIHRISNEAIESLSGGKTFEEYIFNDYKDIFLRIGNVYVGHNVSFDIKLVNATLTAFNYPAINFGTPTTTLEGLREDRNYSLCTMRTTRAIKGFYKSPKLSEAVQLVGVADKIDLLYNKVYKQLGLSKSTYHNADYDTFCTWVVLNQLRSQL
ncbi:hypothetical protein [Clostridium paraputrificum]|uniref:DNA polymerase III subunit epsilon n=1 Tax=Clostridium paraputrificum TaxID=29363 RepID=A0A6N3FC97_9CLOT